MKNNNKNESNFAFIDSQNLHLSIRSMGWKVDFEKFRVYLKDKYNVTKAYLFLGYMPGNEDLYLELQNAEYLLIFKPTVQDKEGVVKGNCDAELVLQAMIDYNNYDKAVIISGDGDFFCLIKHLHDKNKLLKIGIPNKHKYSSLLRKYEPYFFYISDFRQRLKQQKKAGIPEGTDTLGNLLSGGE